MKLRVENNLFDSEEDAFCLAMDLAMLGRSVLVEIERSGRWVEYCVVEFSLQPGEALCALN